MAGTTHAETIVRKPCNRMLKHHQQRGNPCLSLPWVATFWYFTWVLSIHYLAVEPVSNRAVLCSGWRTEELLWWLERAKLNLFPAIFSFDGQVFSTFGLLGHSQSEYGNSATMPIMSKSDTASKQGSNRLGIY